MAQSSQIKVVGAVTAAPATSSLYSCTLQELLSLDACAVYQSSKGNVLTIASTDMAPFTIPFEAITKGRFFAARILAGASMKVLMTTGLGVAPLPLSDLLLIHNPNEGDQFTQIQVVGTGDFAYALAGDLT